MTEQPNVENKDPNRDKWLGYTFTCVVILNVLNWLDYYLTTENAAKYGIGIELNPLTRIVLQHPPVFLLSKLSGSMLLILAYFCLRSLRLIDQKIVFLAFILLIVVYVCAVLVSFV